ncbi:hypothetical protein LTR85_007316 [Meristemomyces frigidus]|nr:hypothetical protein LTR85_007316 [Meristemomyces frigidus]
MKIILAGSTGFIGDAVLQRCLAHPQISSIVALSRRELSVTHPKLQTIIMTDFLHYTPEILAQLEGAAACFWALGSRLAGREVHVDYTLAAVDAFAAHLAMKVGKRGRFCFVYLSGAMTEKDQKKSLWLLSDTRKMRGGIETALADFERAQAGMWESVVVRPSYVTQGESAVLIYAVPTWYIPVSELAAAVVDVLIAGNVRMYMENVELRERGKTALLTLPRWRPEPSLDAYGVRIYT